MGADKETRIHQIVRAFSLVQLEAMAGPHAEIWIDRDDRALMIRARADSHNNLKRALFMFRLEIEAMERDLENHTSAQSVLQ